MSVNWDEVHGKWNQLKGEAQIKWGKLTDDDWAQINGNKDKLLGKLQEAYGWTKEKAEEEADKHFHNTKSE